MKHQFNADGTKGGTSPQQLEQFGLYAFQQRGSPIRLGSGVHYRASCMAWAVSFSI
jgi:hypothetical protein